jgi:Zn-dependent peptidase ImmA (M78 family)
MAGRSRDLIAAAEAERLIRELGINSLPIDPTTIAESLGILVRPKTTTGGISGMLIRVGNEFGIAYATHIDSEGFKRFCIAHEIGHYRLSGHIDAVLAHGDIHESHAGFVTGDPYEREADMFAASLLMPDALFTREMRSIGDGLQAVETLAGRCVTSLPAAANRYVQKAGVPVAMVVSTGPRIDYCFMSGLLQDFDALEWPRKGQQLPAGTETDRFNADPGNIRTAKRADAESELRDWFGGKRSIPGTEEIIGLGRYGRTLTILSTEIFADDEDEDEDLEERWDVRFRR